MKRYYNFYSNEVVDAYVVCVCAVRGFDGSTMTGNLGYHPKEGTSDNGPIDTIVLLYIDFSEIVQSKFVIVHYGVCRRFYRMNNECS